jgi:hypothetical protein
VVAESVFTVTRDRGPLLTQAAVFFCLAPILFAFGVAAYVDLWPDDIERGVAFTAAVASFGVGTRALAMALLLRGYLHIDEQYVTLATLLGKRQICRNRRIVLSPYDPDGFFIADATKSLHVRDKPAGMEMLELYECLQGILCHDET